MIYRSLPWVFVPTIILLVIAGVYVESYDDDPWTEFGVILASIGIALALAIFVIQTHQQGELTDILRKSDERDNREEKDKNTKNDYYEKMIVRALGGIKEISLRITGHIAKNDVDAIHKEWSKFKIPSERLSSLYLVGANVVHHTILDDMDLIRGSLIDDLPEDAKLETIVNLLSYPMKILDSLFMIRLKDRRIEVYKEDVRSLEDQINSVKSNSDFNLESEASWNLYHNSVLKNYARRYLYPGESTDV